MVLLPPRFNLPPIDGTVPPALAIDFHLKNNPDYLFALLHDVADSTQTRITYKQLAEAVHRAAHLVNPDASIPNGTTVGIIVSTDTIVYITIFLAVMRAGLVPFPISPRIPVAGVAHLLKATGTSRLVTGGSPAIDELCATLESTLQADHQQNPISFVSLPTYEELFVGKRTSGSNATKQKSHLFPGLQSIPVNSPVCILHSSGSTGMPKVIVFHLEGVFKNYIIRPVPPMLAEPDTRVGTMASPTFHSMGTMMQIFTPLYAGYIQALFAPHRPPVVPTPHSTLQAAISLGCDYLMCAPAFLETWAQDEDAIPRLGELKCVMFGGGSLAEAVGNKLVNRGVRLLPMYGATELGTVVELSYAERDPRDWPYIKLVPRISIHLDPQNDESGTYELVYVETDGHKPFVYNSKINGRAAYKSKDLVVRHPTNPSMFKIVGRLDDQIALSNGEKCNPLPMEVEIVNSPHVRAAVVFGRERNQTGVIIELEERLSDRYDDKRSRAKLMDEIWPYVENANRIAPTHARLARDAIILTHPAHPFPRTPKGTVSRPAVLKLYAEDIDTTYARLGQDAHGAHNVDSPNSWNDSKAVSVWIGGRVVDILGREVEPNKDLFQQGMDSLTATFLLRVLKAAMNSSSYENAKAAANKLNQQTIFERPTVSQLTAHVLELCSNGGVITKPAVDVLGQVRSMLKKYDSHWPLDVSEGKMIPRVEHKERILITGTSGGLGSHILGQLLQEDRVEKVWAVNRKASKTNRAKQRESFEDKLLDVRLLDSNKLVFLEADLEDERLGLSAETYNEICSQATAIIHNAWQVNFNLSLQSFEPSIRGARNLLDLALNSTSPKGGPRFLFTSSVSVAGLGNHMDRLAESYLRLEDTAAVPGLGYGHSKLIAEQLLKSARERGLEACIARLGQLTGDLASGAWPVSDWVPAILASSISAGCLPAANGTVSWVPLDVAARAIIDTSLSRDAFLPPVINIAHPKPAAWMDIMTLFSKHLIPNSEPDSLPIVKFKEWNQRVGDSAARFRGPEDELYQLFPSQKIQVTIDAMVSADEQSGNMDERESGGIVRMDTREAERVSEALRNAGGLGEDYVKKWIKYWRGQGLVA